MATDMAKPRILVVGGGRVGMYAADLRDLFGWLVARTLEQDDSALLVRLAAEKLKSENVARPGVSRLERIGAAGRGRTDEETHRGPSAVLTEGVRAELNGVQTVRRNLPNATAPPGRL